VAIIFGRGLLARLLLSLLSLPLLKSGLASELGAGSSTHHKRLSLRNLCKPAVRSLRTYLCPSSLIVIIAISALLIFADFQPPELSSTAPTIVRRFGVLTPCTARVDARVLGLFQGSDTVRAWERAVLCA
jgi:hypothetical protein